MFDKYKIALKNEMDILFSTFIHRNKIHPKTNNDKKEREPTPEEKARTERIITMMSNMDKVTIRKEIT